MGGDYKDVIAIPVDDPSVKEIAGALIKPERKGPFPAVIYMPTCYGPNFPIELKQEKFVIDRMLSKGIATFVVDPFMPRGEQDGICGKTNVDNYLEMFTRGGDDAVAALKVLKAMPDIDPNKVMLIGFADGAIWALWATDLHTPGKHDTNVAGVIAYYPYCYDKIDPAVPTLVQIGEKDDWTPAWNCKIVKGKPNFELVVYPGLTHNFTMPWDKPTDFGVHHFEYNEAATKQAADRADEFIAAHLK
jgi:dienelactone hydrolase